MSKKIKDKNLPKLRFVKVVNSGEWVSESFAEMYRLIPTNSYSRDQLNYDHGSVKNIHYGDIHTKFPTLFDITKENVPFVDSSISIDNLDTDFFCIESDIVFADASEDLNDVGKSIEIVNINVEKLLAGMHTILARQRKPKLITGFGGYLFLANGIRIQIQKEAQGAKVFGISGNRLANITICYPESKKEQKKIAECLSSLDNLITAESKKLETLKAHKKGLMQNLFPAEGEKLPKLRFKEFENSGDWEVLPIIEVFSIFQGFAFSSNDGVSNGTRWLKIADVSIQKMNYNTPSYLPIDYKEKYKSFLVKKSDYVIALTRPILNKKLKIAKVDGVFHESLLNQRVGKLISKKNIDFIYYLLQTSTLITIIENNIAGSEPPNLSVQQIERIEVYIPKTKNEQQKISDCLFALDELITAQTEKIESLKLHKKSLIQNLFPNFNGVN